MAKKKILHLITGLEIGGAEMMLLKTLPRLQDDLDNRVCCIIGHGPMGERLEKAGIPVYYLELKNIFDFGIIWRFQKVVHDFQPDILVTYLIHADLFGRIFGRLFGAKKVICSVRVKLIQPKYIPLLLLDAITSPLVTHYHFNSRTVANMYQKVFFLPKKKITIIPNGLEIEKYQISIDVKKKREELGIPREATLIGCVGRLEKQKGQKYLLEAFSKVITQHPNIFLILAGDGADRKTLESLARELKIQDQVKFLGKRNDIPEILNIMDIFVLPSLYEGMSNALMEAMAAGKSIIATNIPENKEFLDDKENGLLVPIKNSCAISSAIKYLIEQPRTRIPLGKNTQRKAEEKFKLDIVISKLTYLFKRV